MVTKIRTCWIYRITNAVNGEVYIGKSMHPDPFSRWEQHMKLLNRGKHQNRFMQKDHDDGSVWEFELIDAMRIRRDDFDWHVEMDDKRASLRLEARWMKHHRKEGIVLYNTVPHRGRYGGRRRVRHP